MAGTTDSPVSRLPADAVTPKEAAAAVGVDHGTMLRWLKQGFIRGYQLGPSTRYRVSLSEVMAAAIRPVEVVPTEDGVRTRLQEEAAATAATERLQKRGYGRGKKGS